jgi:hypothetical protein
MAVYKNDYTKKGDSALWLLHEIRSKMAKRPLDADALNREAEDVIKKYRLNLKVK